MNIFNKCFIIGPRRVGKSTLIYQTINYLLEDKEIEPKRILFFSGDDPSLFFNENDKLSDVLEVYFNEILEESISNLKSKVYIFIDEIHFIKNWQNYLKICFDRKYNIKFIVTGSSSLHLFKDANESLLGRIENIYVLPLTFNQFLNFHRTYVEKQDDIILPKFDLDNPEKSFKDLENYYYDEKLKLDIQKILNEYILVGGYPEYFEDRDIDMWQRRLADDIITRGIYKDILTMYNIKGPEILEKMMYFIADNNSQTFAYSGMTNNDAGHIIEGMTDFDIRLLCEKENYNAYYYRNSDKEEIDIVLDRKIDIIPIEVKFTNQIEMSDTNTIKKFIQNNKNNKMGKTKYGIIITKDIYKKEDDLYFIPYWLFNI